VQKLKAFYGICKEAELSRILSLTLRRWRPSMRANGGDMEVQAEEAFEFLIQHLAKISANISRPALVATRYAHLYLPEVVEAFWRTRSPNVGTVDLTDPQFTVFYDAAWELARIGVLRPGRVAPRNQEMANDFGDLWSVTAFGFRWLEKASARPFIDMSRMSEVLAGFVRCSAPASGSGRSKPSAPTGPRITSRHVPWPVGRLNPYSLPPQSPKAATREKC
jgi:hypothetical protein